jgi:hypothetical protein
MVFSPSAPHRLVNYTLTPSHRIISSISLSRATRPISHPKAKAKAKVKVKVKVKVKAKVKANIKVKVKVKVKVKANIKARARAKEAMEAKGAAKEVAIVSLFRIDDDPCVLI